MITYNEERALVEDIKEGIEIALYDRGYSEDTLDTIKFNKLVYFAITEFDLNITYSWYKFGPSAVEMTDANGLVADMSPNSPSNITAADRPRVPSEKHNHQTPERYAEFYLNLDEFDTIIQAKTKEYLLDFYEEYAPEEYKSLYMACIPLQQTLDKIATEGYWSADGTQDVKQLSDQTNRVYGEILERPALSESVQAFQGYKKFIKNLVTEAASKEEITERQQKFIGESVGFFYNSAWKYTALYISKDTVQGDNSSRLIDSIDGELSVISDRYFDDLERLESNSGLFGLRPRSKRITDNHDEYKLSTSRSSNVDQWTKISSEVIHE
jgi:hypothetical protein